MSGARGWGYACGDADDLLRASDVLSLHVTLNEKSRGCSKRELALMKPDAYLVNTSRGLLIDEQALIAALKEQPDRRQGLDVFDREPLPMPIIRCSSSTTSLDSRTLGYVTLEVVASSTGMRSWKISRAGSPASWCGCCKPK